MSFQLRLSLAVVLMLAGLPASSPATPVCEDLLADCIHDAETELAACIQEPQPPWQCEGEYNVARDVCNFEYGECEESHTVCNPCSASNYTTNPAYCSDPPVTDACGCCERENSPIVLDFGGNGFEFSCADAGVAFAISGRGLPAKWVGWPEHSDDAWLVWDRNANGIIGDASEMFGNATPSLAGGTCSNGYEALAELDDDGNSLVDRRDSHFADLRVWADANRNGLSEPWELRSLEAAGVLALSVEYHETRRRDFWGNDYRYMSWVRVIGSRVSPYRLTTDVYPVTKAMIPGGLPGHCSERH